ncbi:Uncharacterized protein HZ326_30124 [Fusarium oxysporum f. sp. albedinis]|nr:Uncharacterized protein HZ326_30124 [Fusarium oxysporum f. sp. albedinis]
MLISFICAIDISLFIYAFLDNQNLDYGARTRQVRSSSYFIGPRLQPFYAFLIMRQIHWSLQVNCGNTTLIGIFYSTDLNTATRNDDAHCSNRVGVRYKQVRYRLVPLEIQL